MSATVSRAGFHATVPGLNMFDWVFGNPFEHESPYTPKQQQVPRIDEQTPLFVDNATDITLTYSRLRNDALAFAGGLRALGLDPKDTITLPPTAACPKPEVAPIVLVQLPNCLPFPTVVLGSLAAGLTVTLASPSLTATELAWVIKNSRPRVLVVAKSNLENVKTALDAQEDPAYVKQARLYTVDVAQDKYPLGQATSTADDWRSLVSSDHALKSAYSITGESATTRTAIILWSSGTSGRSKGVLLSHTALNFSTASMWHEADFYLGQRQRFLGFVPFYHVFGLTNLMLLGICTGTTVYTMTAFKLDGMLKAISRHQITYLHMAPPVAVMLAKSPVVEPFIQRDAQGRNGFSSLVAGVTGGAPLGHEIVVQVFKRLGFLIRMGYGMSEACSVAGQSGMDEKAMLSYKNDTGRPYWGVELMIASGEDKDTPKPAPLDTPGEILIRSVSLLSAYIPTQGLYGTGSEPDLSVTHETLTTDGWLRTGDVGTLDADGNLCITDRIKEMIKVRAYQVAPAELEALLSSSDDVADAGVVGIHDKDEATEWPRAFVVPRKTDLSEKELQALAQELKVHVESHTARYKWLIGGIVFVKQIPKSPSGKILRRVIREGGVEKGVAVALYQRKKREHKL